MDEREKKFLEENFKAGEYSVVRIMVKNKELPKLVDHLKTSGCTLAVMPEVKAAVDFFRDEPNDGKLN